MTWRSSPEGRTIRNVQKMPVPLVRARRTVVPENPEHLGRPGLRPCRERHPPTPDAGNLLRHVEQFIPLVQGDLARLTGAAFVIRPARVDLEMPAEERCKVEEDPTLSVRKSPRLRIVDGERTDTDTGPDQERRAGMEAEASLDRIRKSSPEPLIFLEILHHQHFVGRGHNGSGRILSA
jgi:hypothetical protein